LGQQEIEVVLKEADSVYEANPDHFESPGFNQPPGAYVTMATEYLGGDAPWHRIGMLAHAFKEAEEREIEERKQEEV